LARIAARGPAKIAAVQPAARSDTTDPDEIRGKFKHVASPDMIVPNVFASTAADGDVQDLTKSGTAPSSAWLNTELANSNSTFDVRVNQADAKTAADHPEKNYGIEPLDQDKAQSVKVQFSSPEKENGIAKSSLANFAMSEDKRDVKIPDASAVNIGDMKTREMSDMKTSEMRMPGRPRMAVKRQAANRNPVKQASLEARNGPVCSGAQSCSADMPPLFGVGF
jgi:hypothetical protein